MLKFKFVGLKNISLEITGKNIIEILNVQRDEKFASFSPIAFVVPSGNVYYYDENKIIAMLNFELSREEFTESCQCLALYRNSVEIKSAEGYFLEAGYLWKNVSGNKLILINDELYVEYDLNEMEFEKIV
jgi:hypothetical protein